MRLSTHHDHRRGDAGSFQILKERQSIAPWHYYVTEDQVEGLGTGQFQRASGVVADDGFMAREAESASQRSQRIGLVIDDQNLCLGGHDLVSFISAAFGASRLAIIAFLREAKRISVTTNPTGA